MSQESLYANELIMVSRNDEYRGNFSSVSFNPVTRIGKATDKPVKFAQTDLELARRACPAVKYAYLSGFFRLKISAAERTFKNDGDDLKRTEANLENLLVKAPFAGRVIGLAMRAGQDVPVKTCRSRRAGQDVPVKTCRSRRAGQDVPISAKLLTLADISQLIVKGNVDATSEGAAGSGGASNGG